ncbi:AzlC family ABC transporter permease [Rhodovibrionaceae bacterium A322]
MPPPQTPLPSARQEFSAGAIAALPVFISVAAYGLLLGSLARQAGLAPLEVLAMSGFIFAGGSQFVILDLWQEPLPIAALLISVLLVNLRHLLMGATLGPHLKGGKSAGSFFQLFFMADENWALAMQRARSGGLTTAFYLGLSLPLYVIWLSATFTGSLVGNVITDPAAWGFDFVFAAVFLTLLAGMWQGPRQSALPWLASAGSAALSSLWLPGAWYILIGAGAGMAVAAAKGKAA